MILFVTLAFVGCTIRIEPLPKKKTKVYVVHRHHKHKTHHVEKPLSGEMVPTEEIKLIPQHPEPTP